MMRQMSFSCGSRRRTAALRRALGTLPANRRAPGALRLQRSVTDCAWLALGLLHRRQKRPVLSADLNPPNPGTHEPPAMALARPLLSGTPDVAVRVRVVGHADGLGVSIITAAVVGGLYCFRCAGTRSMGWVHALAALGGLRPQSRSSGVRIGRYMASRLRVRHPWRERSLLGKLVAKRDVVP